MNCRWSLSFSDMFKNYRAHMNVLLVKWMLYYQRGALSGLELYVNHDWGVIIQDMHGGLLSRRHFVRTIGHNLQIIRHILAFYIPNDLATIGDIASRLQSCTLTLTGQLRLQTRIMITFSSDFYAQLSNYTVYTSVLHNERVLFCSWQSFSTLEPRTSSDWQATSANTYRHHFLVWLFLRTSSTTRTHWRLQHYHTPNNSRFRGCFFLR